MPLRLPFCSLLAVAVAGLLDASCIRRSYFQPDARPDAALAQPLPAAADSVRGATAGRQYARHGGLFHALVGRHHRRTWAAPVAVPVLRLATALPGGLRPGNVGGGFNSTSLTLVPPTGPPYVLRTVDKDPVRATPVLLRGTFLVNALRDNVSATHPFGALVVPPLAAAAGVPHAGPRLVYVRPDDPAFQGDSLRLFRGQLAYLEEKVAVPAGSSDAARPAVVDSPDAFASVFASPAHRLDQPALLRARLLDAWLGDWDRHEGQWNWAISPPDAQGVALLSPLPKDRDMVFYRGDDGALGWLLGHVFQRHWVTFGPRYASPNGLLSSGRYLDARGLNALTRAQFAAAARAMQQRLPDTLIHRALRRLPPAAYALEGPRLAAALLARRAALPELADKFYAQRARRPIVGGTARAERFAVHRYADSTVVAVYPAGATTSAYRRTFLPAETRVIRLEGLGGDDVFTIEQHAPRSVNRPRLRLYGGPGRDEISGPARNPHVRFNQDSGPAQRAYDHPPKD